MWAVIRFEPLDERTWPSPAKAGRRYRSCRFKTSYSLTLAQLDDELRRVGGRMAVIELDLAGGDIRRDGLPYASARPSTPRVRLSFEHQSAGTLQFACDTYERWWENIRAIVLTLAALRAVNRYGAVHGNEQYKGWARLPERAGVWFPTTDSAWKFLERHAMRSAGSCDEHGLQVVYREAAARCHPDKRHGSDDLMSKVNAARDKIRSAFRPAERRG